jgi:hypothetical protein
METNLLDSWDSNNGTGLVGAGPNYGLGQVGQALSNSVVTVADAPSLHFTNGLTVQAWINTSTLSGAAPYTIVSKYEAPFTSITATQSCFYLGLNASAQPFIMVSSNGLARTNVTVSSTQNLTPGQWYFIVATYDHTHLRLYINGQLSISKDFFTGIFPGTARLSIGGVPTGSIPSVLYPFTGLIDEVCLYSRALSAAEISAIYNADGAGMCVTGPTISGPQSQAIPLNEDAQFSVSVIGNRPLTYQWRFNGTNILGATNSSLYLEHVQSNSVGNYSVVVSNQVSSAISSSAALTLLPPLSCIAPPPGIISWWPLDNSEADAAGTNNGQTIFPPLPPFNAFTTGKVDYALATRMTVPNSASLNFGSNADFSWEGWIKFPPSNFVGLFREPTNIIVNKFDISSGYSLSLPGGQLALRLGFTPLAVSTFVAPGADLRDNHFHHIACTVSRRITNGSHLYVDGANALSFDVTRFSGVLSNASSLIFGTEASLRFPPPDTLIDEMTVYSRALTGDEIASIYHAGSAGKCKNPPGILQQPQSRTVTETSNVTFTVSGSGLGLHYQWRFFNANLPGATRTSLTLSNITFANSGSYSVRVTNLFGSITSSVAVLTVERLPVALCTNVIVSADASCTASASIDNGSYDPDGTPVTLSQSPSGPYPLGTNVVMLAVTDTNGIVAQCNGTVVVIDTTPPVITCPAQEMIVEFSDETGATVSFDVHATDNCSGAVTLVSVPPSGTRFPIGTSTVTNTATDAAGNSAACAFQITVLGAQGVLSNVLVELTGLAPKVDRPPDLQALQGAIQNLNDSLNVSLWLDQTHVTRSHGEQIFNDDKAALQELSRLLKEKHSPLDDELVQDLINRIAKSDRLLATIAIQDALASGIDPKRLAQATDEVAAGDADVGDAQYESGIAHYRDAWKMAVQQAFKLVASLGADGPVLEFESAPGDQFVIETSTNLTDWTELDAISAAPDGSVRFQDSVGDGFEVRYYRARRVQ